MSHDEIRFLRRELINQCLYIRHEGTWAMSLKSIKFFVRYGECEYYGYELNLYK